MCIPCVIETWKRENSVHPELRILILDMCLASVSNFLLNSVCCKLEDDSNDSSSKSKTMLAAIAMFPVLLGFSKSATADPAISSFDRIAGTAVQGSAANAAARNCSAAL